jgi:uncharacterized protein YdcH (DUF465 family)
LIAKIKPLKETGINIDQINYRIEFRLGGDLLFLANMLGIKIANSSHPWCTVNIKRPVSSNLPNSYRTHEEANRILNKEDQATATTSKQNEVKAKRGQHKRNTQTNKKSNLIEIQDDPNFGYKHLPIIDFISYDDVIIDLLHLILRISDMIFDSLIDKINILDDKIRSVKLEERPILNHFFGILTEKCNIRNPYYIIKAPGKQEIKLRSLNGDDRVKIFSIINKDGNVLSNFFLQRKDGGGYEKIFTDLNLDNEDIVWKDFYKLYRKIKRYPKKEINLVSLKKKLKVWLGFYLLVKEGSQSPYVHAFTSHFPDMLAKHNNLNFYNQEGLEKLNDFIRIYYFRSSNKNLFNKSYLHQILNKRNRIEFFKLSSFREKNDFENHESSYDIESSDSESSTEEEEIPIE